MTTIRRVISLLLLVGTASAVSAQNSAKIEEQKRVIQALEKKIAAEEREIEKIRKGRSSTEEQVRRLSRQIDSRSQMIDATEKEASLLRREIARKSNLADSLAASLGRYRVQYAEMVREAYRNYRYNNYLTYLFSARDFADVARRISSLRAMAAMRERTLAEIESTSSKVRSEKESLDKRRNQLDSVSAKLVSQREKLKRDSQKAKSSIKQLSQREKNALRRKIEQEQRLDVAISELRKLSKGNKEGASFSSKTSGLKLPVVNGKVKRYKGNMAEIAGPKDAQVVSIYEGKVVETKQNRITGKFEVFIAHGEYITSYANLGSVCVEKGQKIARNQQIGTIGSSVDFDTMQTGYRIVFGIYPPDPKQTLKAENCFKR